MIQRTAFILGEYFAKELELENKAGWFLVAFAPYAMSAGTAISYRCVFEWRPDKFEVSKSLNRKVDDKKGS